MKSKLCSRCHVEKIISDFSIRNGRPTEQYQSACKACQAQAALSAYHRNRQSADLGYWSRLMFKCVTVRALNSNIKCSVTPSDIYFRALEAKGVCAYCSNPLNFYAGYKNRRWAASIDRLDSKGGYTLQNIIVCCYRCNTIKGDATSEELRNLASAIDGLLSLRKHGCRF